jgi:PIN domain nuclease of toxin-antitoxin system
MSEVIVLDTHIWFWWMNQEFERFPSHWRDILETAHQVGISPVSCYEITLAQQKGRLALPCPANQWFQNEVSRSQMGMRSAPKPTIQPAQTITKTVRLTTRAVRIVTQAANLTT